MQAYWTMYNEEKVRPRFLEFYREQNRKMDNTNHLDIDEALVVPPKLSDAEQRAQDDSIIKSITWAVRRGLVQEMYDNESKEIKETVEHFRKAVMGSVESEANLEVRLQRLENLDE